MQEYTGVYVAIGVCSRACTASSLLRLEIMCNSIYVLSGKRFSKAAGIPDLL